MRSGLFPSSIRKSGLDNIRQAMRESKGVTPLLWPGEFFCRLLGVHDKDSRFLLRMFINLSILGKLAVFAVLVALHL